MRYRVIATSPEGERAVTGLALTSWDAAQYLRDLQDLGFSDVRVQRLEGIIRGYSPVELENPNYFDVVAAWGPEAVAL